MTGRRTLFVWCALALLIAAGVWLALRSSPGPSAVPATNDGLVHDAPTDRIPVALPEDAPAAVQTTEDTARDVAGSAPDATPPDDVTLDQLSSEPIDDSPRTTLSGRVLDDADKPVQARVFVSTKRTLAGALLDAPVNQDRVMSCTSEADGRFTLAGVETGLLRLAVRHDGFAPLDAREVSVAPGPGCDVGDLHLQRGVILAGRVLDPEQRPVPEAILSLVEAPLLGPVHRLGPLTEPRLGASDEAGRFELACVPAGMLTLRVSHHDFPDALFEIEARADLPRVDDLQFVLQRGTTISGSLLDFDQRATPGLVVFAMPVEGLHLFQVSKPEGASVEWLAGSKTAEVDPFGRFCVTGLEPALTYQLQARRNQDLATGADQEIQDRWAPPTIAHAGATEVEVCYQPGCRIDFEVVDRASGLDLEQLNIRLSGVSPAQPLDEHGKPRTLFPGGIVSMLDLRAIGAAPAYEPGKPREDQVEVTLTIEAPGHDSRVLAGLRLDPGARIDLGPVRIDSMNMLEVRVLDVATHAPLAEARVVLTADHPELVEGRTSSVAITRGNGLARLTSLPTLSSTVSISCAGYAPTSFAAPAVVRDGAQPIEALLASTATVTASVRDTRGSRLAGNEVILWRDVGPAGPAWARVQSTDASGIAVFRDIPEGTLSIQAKSSLGFTRERNTGALPSSARTLLVHSGESIAVELELAALSALSGTIWRGPEPLAGATISFSSDRWAFRDLGTDMELFASAPHVVTDSRGEFSAVELVPGDCTLLIEQRDHGLRTRRVVRVENVPTSVILDVEDTQITGRVIDQRGQPVGQALVQLFVDRPGRRTDIRPSLGDFLVPQDDWRRPVAETRTEANGEYCLSSVPPGIPLEMFFSLGRRAASKPRINAPQGRILEHVDVALPDGGALDIILVAPLAPPGLHYGVRIAALKQPEGLTLEGAVFDEQNRAQFDGLPPGEWVVMVFELDPAGQVVDRRKPQTVQVKSNQTTEFSVGW